MGKRRMGGRKGREGWEGGREEKEEGGEGVGEGMNEGQGKVCKKGRVAGGVKERITIDTLIYYTLLFSNISPSISPHRAHF